MTTKNYFLIAAQPSMSPPEFATYVRQNYTITYADGCTYFDIYVDPIMGRVGVEGTIEGPNVEADPDFNRVR